VCTYVRKCTAVRGSAIAVAIEGVRAYESVPLYADRYSVYYSGSAVAVLLFRSIASKVD